LSFMYGAFLLPVTTSVHFLPFPMFCSSKSMRLVNLAVHDPSRYSVGCVWKQLTVISVAHHWLFCPPRCMITILFHCIAIRMQRVCYARGVLQQWHTL
jgi:hypothetical protein